MWTRDVRDEIALLVDDSVIFYYYFYLCITCLAFGVFNVQPFELILILFFSLAKYCLSRLSTCSVCYNLCRDKKGPFRSVDEVTRVRGMRSKLTRHLHPHLTTCDTAATQPAQPPVAPPRDTLPPLTVKTLHTNRLKGHRRTLSAPLQNNAMVGRTESQALVVNCADPPHESAEEYLSRTTENEESWSADGEERTGHRLSIDFSSDVYELLSLRSERPEISNLFENNHMGRSAVRIATWNLSHLTPDKLSNPGVMEVLCRTILERGFTILAVQDVLGSGLLDKIATELNTGSLRRVREWPGKRGTWACIQSKIPVGYYTLLTQKKKKCHEFSGFLYNKRFVELVEDFILNYKSSYAFVCKPYIATFKANELNFTLVNIHIKHQVKIYRSESFLQSSSNLQDLLSRSCTARNGLLPDATSHNVLDALKSCKNLQNGLIKDSILGRDDVCRGGVRTSTRSEGGADEDCKRTLSEGDGAGADAAEVQDMVTHIVNKCGIDSAVIILGHFGTNYNTEGTFNIFN